jgi:hypothetical protein
MKTFNKIAAQGDIMIIKVAELPNKDTLQEVSSKGSNIIVTHSETGHHHVMEREKVTMFECKDNELECFLEVHRKAELKHLRPHDTHESILFEPGVYKIRRQREYTPEGYRRVQD